MDKDVADSVAGARVAWEKLEQLFKDDLEKDRLMLQTLLDDIGIAPTNVVFDFRGDEIAKACDRLASNIRGLKKVQEHRRG